jgi:hypothetical protein
VGAANFAPRKAAMTNGDVQFTRVRKNSCTPGHPVRVRRRGSDTAHRRHGVGRPIRPSAPHRQYPLPAPRPTGRHHGASTRQRGAKPCRPSLRRIPLIFSRVTDQHPSDARFELGLGLGCLDQFVSRHGSLGACQPRSLVKQGVPPDQRAYLDLWRHTFGAVLPHRPLTFDHRAADCGSIWKQP